MISRKNLFIILFTVLFIPSITAASIINSGFEDWTTINPPPGWSLSSGEISAAQETTQVHSGSSSAMIVYTSQFTQSLSQTINATPGLDYSISAYFYDSNPSGYDDGRARISLSFLDDEGNTLSTNYSGYTVDDDMWQQLWVSAIAPSVTDSIKISFLFYDVSANWDGSATIYVDSVAESTNAVPIPGAVWLLGSGLIGIVGIRRKFNK